MTDQWTPSWGENPQTETNPAENSQPSTESQSEETLGNQFLSNVPEADRLVVEKYVKDWDGQVTKKFQSYTDQLKQYEGLGNPEDIQKAVGIAQWIATDPDSFYEQFKARYEEFNGTEEAEEVIDQEEWDNLTPEQQKIAELEYQVSQLTESVTSNDAEVQSRKDAEELDKTLKTLHTSEGDFDDDYVVALIANGVNPNSAVKQYQGLQQKIIDSHQTTPPPPVLREGGGIPKDQVDKSKLKDPKYRKEVGVRALQALKQQ